MAGPSSGTGGEQTRDQEEDVVLPEGPPVTSAIRIGAALVGTLIFVVAEPTQLPARDPTPARPVEINLRQAKPAERIPASPESVAAAEVPPARGDEPAEETRRSLQDHDDVEESDRTDREGREGDGDVVNGDFEGSSVSRGHSITTSNSDSPGDSDD